MPKGDTPALIIYCHGCGKKIGEIYDAWMYHKGRDLTHFHNKCLPTRPTEPKYDLPEWAKESLFGGFRK